MVDNDPPTSTLIPTRDLPPLRPLPGVEVIRIALDQLAKHIGLGQERCVHLPLLADHEGGCGTFHVNQDDLEDDRTDDGDEDEAHLLFSDTIESRFAQTWLTRVISTSWLSEETNLQDKAGEILAALCGKSASTPEKTRFHIGPIQVVIQDSPITADALGNRTWGAAPLLARRILSKYARPPSPLCLKHEGQFPPTILELGAGTGLVGLSMAALAMKLQRKAKIDLTDYHPHVLSNLRVNVDLNLKDDLRDGQDQRDHDVRVSIARLDWQEIHNQSLPAISSAESTYQSTAQTIPDLTSCAEGSRGQAEVWPSIDPMARYQLLVACDCVYDPFHPLWIRSVAQRHLSKPSGTLYLISPLRRTHQAEIDAIYEAFPLSEFCENRCGGQGGGKAMDGSEATEVGEERCGGRREGRLEVVWQGDEVGYDNFGPAGGVDVGGQKNKGIKTIYRTWEIRWTQ